MIDGVRIKRLVRHVDDRGYLMEVLRDDDEEFVRFGQIYVALQYPGIVKAWHCHERQHDNMCVVSGSMKVGLSDQRPDSPTCGQREWHVIGEHNPTLIQIPPGVWHGIMVVGPEPALLLNIPTQHYDPDQPDELRREAFDHELGDEWEPRDR
jgi:dTDP-4-dehydrorhamnose 3,5-epimerase